MLPQKMTTNGNSSNLISEITVKTGPKHCKTLSKAKQRSSPICPNRSKGKLCALNALHVSQLVLDTTAISTTSCVSPGHNPSICQNCSKCSSRGTNLFDIFQLRLDFAGVAAPVWIAPSYNSTIFQNCSKSALTALNVCTFSSR